MNSAADKIKNSERKGGVGPTEAEGPYSRSPSAELLREKKK